MLSLIYGAAVAFIWVQHVSSLHIKDQPVGDADAVLGLISRLLGPTRAAHFAVNITGYSGESEEYQDIVTVRRVYDQMMIEGTSGTAVTYGFHHYLKYYIGYHVSWDGDQLSLPFTIDTSDITLRLLDKYRYNMNVCTFSYSYVWWNWTRWEREIDWMALNGYNFVLAFTGTEAVWQQVYLELGFTQEEIDDHFTGPAFLAWNRMGNIRGGNKLSDNWHRTQVELQKKILKRMRSLGITPILPAFAGHLPVAIKRLYPNASITRAARWNKFPDEFCCPALLNPSDPLFVDIGRKFITKLTEMFGTNHVYNCDPFNEMNPSTSNPKEIAEYGRSIYSSMKTADESAIWVLQGWFLANAADFWTSDRAEAFLTSVEIGQLIVLDLQSEINPQYGRLRNYFGRHFIWCMLHNFGGTLGLQGSLPRVVQALQDVRKSVNSTMIGVGITMEGINTNYAVYDFFSDLMIGQVNRDWAHLYATRRYGLNNEDAIAAWNYLMHSVYSYNGSVTLHGQYVFNNRPSLKKNVKYWYDEIYINMAWQSLLRASSSFFYRPSNLFEVDLVDVTRQGLQQKMNSLYREAILAYKNEDLGGIKNITMTFLEALDDMERILGTNKRFLLGVWLEDAKSMASTPLEKHIFEREARNQISLWGPNGEILDYANKQWAGVVQDYFKPRWVIFFKYLTEAAQTGYFDNKGYRQSVSGVEQYFAGTNNLYPTEPKGDAVKISRELYRKWISTSGL